MMRLCRRQSKEERAARKWDGHIEENEYRAVWADHWAFLWSIVAQYRVGKWIHASYWAQGQCDLAAELKGIAAKMRVCPRRPNGSGTRADVDGRTVLGVYADGTQTYMSLRKDEEV